MTLEAYALTIVLPVLVAAIAISFLRLWMGPSLADRVVVLDLMGVISIGVMCVYALARRQTVFLDVALVAGLVSFLGTVAFAYYLERRP